MNKLYIVCGIQGSGKSTYCNKNYGVHISRDDIRFSMMKEGEDYFSHEKEVFNEFVRRVQESIDNNPITYADATHLNWKSRGKLIRSLNLDNVLVSVVEIICLYSTCVARNNSREGIRRVPEEVILDCYSRYRPAKDDPYHYFEYIEVSTN